MNINDVDQVPIDKDRLDAIFERQMELIIKYKDIEGMPDFPMDIDSKVGQRWFKDFYWRCTEELMEAWECIKDEDPTHFKEEIADALHFLVEAFIISGVELEIPASSGSDKLYILFFNTYAPPNFTEGDKALAIYDVIFALGMCGNTLKN